MHFSRTLLVTASSLPLLLAQSLPANWPSAVVASFTPKAELTLEYPDVSIDTTTAGQLVSLDNAAPEPLFRLEPSLPGPLLIIMIDPDAPTPQQPNASQILHMLQTDFSPDPANEDIISSSTPALATYRGPGPPAGSDPHRYIFAVFEQPPTFTLPEGFNATNRRGFNITDFALVTGLGSPVAGGFFTAQRDAAPADSVPVGSGTVGGEGVTTTTPGVISTTSAGSGNIGNFFGNSTITATGVSDQADTTIFVTSTSTVWMSDGKTIPAPGSATPGPDGTKAENDVNGQEGVPGLNGTAPLIVPDSRAGVVGAREGWMALVAMAAVGLVVVL